MSWSLCELLHGVHKLFRQKELSQNLLPFCHHRASHFGVSLSLVLSLGLCPVPEVYVQYKRWDLEALEANETSVVLQREEKEKESGMSFPLTTSSLRKGLQRSSDSLISV